MTKSPPARLGNRLVFRIVSPIVLIWLLGGASLYYVILGYVSDFLENSVSENMTWLARDVSSICNSSLDEIIMSGRAGELNYERIAQIRTLNLIKEFLQESDTQVAIYRPDDAAGEPFFTSGLDFDPSRLAEIKIKMDGVTSARLAGLRHYFHASEFPPWGWRILLIKSADAYSALASRIRYLHLATLLAVTLTSLLVIAIIHSQVNAPIGRIIQRLKQGKRPDYHGVYEIEFLSRTISRMMRSLEELNKHLEGLVYDRTRDLAEQTRELERANLHLMELDRMKSAFLSSVSHELRTPLTAIMGFTKLVSKDLGKIAAPGEADDEAERGRRAERMGENLAIITQEGQRLTRLINDVLDMARIQDGRMSWNDQPVTLAQAAGRAMETPAVRAAGRPAELALDLPPGLPPLIMDPERLEQALANLASCSLRRTESGPVSMAARLHPDGGLCLRVSCSGVGGSRDLAARLFEMFPNAGRGDTMGAPGRTGTGLGLAITRQIVEHYGGLVWAEAREGGNFVFYVELPDTILG